MVSLSGPNRQLWNRLFSVVLHNQNSQLVFKVWHVGENTSKHWKKFHMKK